MQGYDAATYGDRIAEVYDELTAELDPAPAVEALARLAGGGPALELAIGSGRVALPLAARGVEVHGIDASEAMVAKLRAKPGGDAIPVTMGNFADVPVAGTFRLIFVTFNTLFALTTQDEQIRCFENVASHLTEDGVFVVEAFVPDVTRFDRGQRTSTMGVELEEIRLEASRYDPAAQRVTSQHVHIREGGVRFYPVVVRFAWPSELDLMARVAGLRLRERWSAWDGAPFDGESKQHVSVYERA